MASHLRLNPKALTLIRSFSSNPQPPSFRDLFKNHTLSGADRGGADRPPSIDFDSIRHSLRNLRIQDGQQHQQQARRPLAAKPLCGILRRPVLNSPVSTPNVPKTRFLKSYSYEELGEKLRKLRPAAAATKGGCSVDWFSLAELNERLVKLREMEEKELESKAGGSFFKELRDSLEGLKEDQSKNVTNIFYPHFTK